MPLDAPTLAALAPELDEGRVREHLGRLDEAYLKRFDARTIALHLQYLTRLSAANPVEVLLNDAGVVTDESGRRLRAVEVTVFAFDHPFEFSLIAGVLSGTGVQIDSGDVFTLQPASGGTKSKAASQTARREAWRQARLAARMGSAPAEPAGADPFRRRVIIDFFRGRLSDPAADFDTWATQFRAAIIEVITLLDKGDAESVNRAKHRVNELVTEHLVRVESTGRPMMLPVELSIDQVGPADNQQTRLHIVAQDTQAFLYSLSTALSLHGLSIERVRIGGGGGRVEDEIFVVGPDGKPITNEQMLERVKLSVLLTKQFTYFLDRAPDPFTALTRFEELTERITQLPERGRWMELLADPRTMEDLARLLGTSNYLWEDFIRGQYESLLPIFAPHLESRQFCPPAETIPLRLEEAMQGAVGLAEKQDRLNKFKDQEIFLIDLDHILNPGSDFRDLSQRLTVLAECLVAAAAGVVYDDLVASYGTPILDSRQPAHYAVFGLGKLGGVALGYASDIELLFIYTGVGKTTGGKRKALTNVEFFQQHARETSQFIRTKREGIFQVDLRLRPYGKDGPLASSLELFQTYYGPQGNPHPFEKLALVRLRWIAGDPRLGFEVEELRDRFVYDDKKLDFDALWDVWARQREQRSEGGNRNAKHSPGALADLEGTVQLLQVMHADQAPQLRSPRLSSALESLRRAGVLSPREFAELVGAYYFFRRLINALRVLRGSALDLFLPPADSNEFLHLARRMGYEARRGKEAAQQLSAEFDNRTAIVRRFVKERFGRPCPGAE